MLAPFMWLRWSHHPSSRRDPAPVHRGERRRRARAQESEVTRKSKILAAIHAPRLGAGGQTPKGDVKTTDGRDARRLERDAGTVAAAD
jgi:hypothetical protein